MKKSSNVLLSAVFLTTVASFMADKTHAQQSLSNSPASSDMRRNEADSSSHHDVYPNTVHRGFFGRLFHRNPKPSTQNTVNDGPRRTENTMSKVVSAPKNSGGFGSTGNGSAHS
jgi:hypothetical protein